MVAYTIKNAANTKHSLKIYDEDDFYHQNNNGSPQNEAPQKELKVQKVGIPRWSFGTEWWNGRLCKKLPIFRVVEADIADGISDERGERLPAKRKYRFNWSLSISIPQ